MPGHQVIYLMVCISYLVLVVPPALPFSYITQYLLVLQLAKV